MSNPETYVVPFKMFLTGGFFNLSQHINLIFTPYKISINNVHLAYKYNEHALGIFEKTHWDAGKKRIDAALKLIHDKFIVFYIAMAQYNSNLTNEAKKKECLLALDDVEDVLRMQLSINGPFRDSDISSLSLGYFTIIATIHILILSYASLNGKKLGMIDYHLEDINTQLQNIALNYIKHANKAYKAGLDDTTNKPIYRKISGDEIFDYVNGWSYIVNQVSNYSKGVNYELIRDPRAELLSNPMVSFGIDDMNSIVSKLKIYSRGEVTGTPGPNVIKNDAAYVIDVLKYHFKDQSTFARDHFLPTFSTLYTLANKSIYYGFKSAAGGTAKYSLAIKYHFSGGADKATMTFLFNGNAVGTSPATFEKCERSDGFNEYRTKFLPGRVMNVEPNVDNSLVITTQNNIYIHSIIFIPSN